MKRIGVLTSGGDAPGMNAAIRAVVRSCVFNQIECYGIFMGYDGLINGKVKELDVRSVAKILDRGGTILKSSRSDEFRTMEGRKKAHEVLVKYKIDGLIVIGGNGTFTGAHILYEEYGLPIVGIPGTIDNDLYGSDNTIGYDTATNSVVEAVDKIRDTANSHSRLFFVEVMGRDAGFIALKAGISTGAIVVMLPEEKQSISDLVEILEKGAKSKKTSSIVIVAEGDANGGAYKIAQKVKKEHPEYDTKVAVLGHIQRGGTPSAADRVLASRLGVSAVNGLLNGEVDVMVGLLNERESYVPLIDAIYKKKNLNKEELNILKILSI